MRRKTSRPRGFPCGTPDKSPRHGIIRAVPVRSRTNTFAFVVILLVLAVVGSVSYIGWRQSIPGPRVTSVPPRALGHKTAVPIVVEASRGNVAGVEVRVVQAGKSAVVVQQDGPLGRRAEIPATLEISNLGLREGPATIEVRARDD